MDSHVRIKCFLLTGSLAVLLAVHGGGRRAGRSDQVAAEVQSALLIAHQHYRYDTDSPGRSSGFGLFRDYAFLG